MKKKLLLTFMLLVGTIVFTAVNASAADINDLEYSISGGEVAIRLCDNSATGKLIIPDTIEGYPVTSIGDGAFEYCSGLESITIPDSVISIGEDAFYYCSGLKSITIPDSVASISDGMFQYCTGLESITFPKNVTSIGKNAFYYCSGLKSITIPDSIVLINEGAFQYCTGLKSITIPDSVTSIKSNAFAWCADLTSVTISDSVTFIGGGAFSYCPNLTSIKIPDSVTFLGGGAFESCIRLTTITIPDSVTFIDVATFISCSRLVSVVIPESVTLIDDIAFLDCNNLKKIYYCGSEDEWNSINIKDGNSVLNSVEIIFNYIPSSAAVDIISATSTDNSLKLISLVEFENEPEISAFGTTFIPLWLFETGSSDSAVVEYDNSQYNIANGQSFGATLSDIPDSAKDMLIVGKSFIKNADGTYTWSPAKAASVNDTTIQSLN